MRVDIILADAAQTVGGKGYVLGAGWSDTRGEIPMAVVVFLEVPWNDTNRRQTWVLELVDSDNTPVIVPGPAGPQAIRIEGEFEVGRPPGAIIGAPITPEPITVNFGPLPLEPGRYVWRFSFDGESQEGWSRAFTKHALTP